MGFHQCHAKLHSICLFVFFTAISKITTEIFVKICWQLKTLTRTWKCTRCLMQMSYLYASDFPFKSFRKLAQHAETIRKNVWEKSYDVYSLSVRVQTTINHISNCFFTTTSTSKKTAVFWARAEKGIARHIDASSVVWEMGSCWDLVIFDWFVLSMRMQVILDSLFAHPGSAPIWGGKKGGFRDWTTSRLDSSVGRALYRSEVMGSNLVQAWIFFSFKFHNS